MASGCLSILAKSSMNIGTGCSYWFAKYEHWYRNNLCIPQMLRQDITLQFLLLVLVSVLKLPLFRLGSGPRSTGYLHDGPTEFINIVFLRSYLGHEWDDLIPVSHKGRTCFVEKKRLWTWLSFSHVIPLMIVLCYQV